MAFPTSKAHLRLQVVKKKKYVTNKQLRIVSVIKKYVSKKLFVQCNINKNLRIINIEKIQFLIYLLFKLKKKEKKRIVKINLFKYYNLTLTLLLFF